MASKSPSKEQLSKILKRLKRDTVVLDSIWIQGFKSLKNVFVPLSPITVFLGGNSSGKSSVLQSILLMSQNLQNRPGPVLDLNGVAVSLGSVEDVRCRSLEANQAMNLTFGFVGWESKFPSSTSTSLSFDFQPPISQEEFRKSQVHIPLCRLQIKIPTVRKTSLASRLVSAPEPANNSERNTFDIRGNFPLKKATQNLKENIDNFRVSPANFTEASKGEDYKSLTLAMKAHSPLEPHSPTSHFFSGSFFPALPFSGQSLIEVELFEHIIGLYSMFTSLAKAKESSMVVKYRRFSNFGEKMMHHTDAKSHSQLVSKVRKAMSQTPRGRSRYEINLTYKEMAFIENILWHFNEKLLDAQQSNLEASYKQILSRFPLADYSDDGLLHAFVELNKTNRKRVLHEKFFSSLPVLKELQEDALENAAILEGAMLEYLAGSVHYLGPLRAHSLEDHYGWSPKSNLIPLGAKGENLGRFLDSPEASRKKTYPLPPRKSDLLSPSFSQVSLIVAMNAWISWFNLGTSVGIDDQAVWGTHLELDAEKMFQKGTGVSQILPVIALCLKADPGSTVMIEQPELHLHPALQQRLGTFFALLSKAGRRLLLETHSEYLVTRLRREIAVGKITSEDLGLLFVRTKKDRDGKNITLIKKAQVTDSGIVPIWPQGFFDFTVDDKLDIKIASSKSTT